MTEKPSAARAAASQERKSAPNWGLRVVLALVLVAAAVLAYFVLASFLPVWWANVVGNQTQGSLGGGALLGLFYGFVFTYVPLLVAWQARHRQVTWPWKAVLLVAAVALAAPNLLTLGVMLGSSTAAHNAQRIIGTEATWFPSWSAGAAVGAVVVFIATAAAGEVWRARGRKMKQLKAAERARRVQDAAADEPGGTGRPDPGPRG